MNIIEKAVEKLEAEVDDLLREQREGGRPSNDGASRSSRVHTDAPEPGDAGARASGDAPPAPAQPAMPPPAPPHDGVAMGQSRSEVVKVNIDALGASGFVTPARDQSLLAEEFRLIKRPLLARATPGDPTYVDHGNLIIITSSLPGEGKTFNSVNLAFSIAMEVDRTVLLVDADVAKQDVSKVFELGERRGLSNYLDGSETDLSRLLVRTDVESLSVLPSGPRHPRITELLASTQMRSLVRELAERYPDRIVLFDSPPLLATTGASVLAGLMGQVVMVIEAVRTPQHAVRESLRRLGARTNVSIVFNKQRRMGAGEYSYGMYGYGFGYGYGYGDDKDPPGAR